MENTLLMSEEYDLYESFSGAVRGWDLDFRQLGPQQGSFFLEQMMGKEVFFSRAAFPSRLHQLGASTPGYRTVSMLASGSAVGWRWCGEAVSHSSLLVMPVGGEFESFSMPGVDTLHMALSIPLLEEVAENQFRQPLHEIMPDGRCFCPDGGESLVRLRQVARTIRARILAGVAPSQQSLQISREYELAYLVLDCFARGNTHAPGVRRSKRMQVLDKALDCIAGEAGDIDVAGLVRATGVSRRTLEHAFQDGMGTGPAAYLKALKLTEFSRRLLAAHCRDAGVAELARDAGFTHLGQLAADYRAMFGESPRDTLRR